MSKPKITILIPGLSQSTDSFKELISTLLLSLYEVRPHTGLLATYQLSRRLNMINLPTQLIWDELTRKIGYPIHYWREKCKQLIDVGLNLSDYKFGQEHKRKYEKDFSFKSSSVSVQVRRNTTGIFTVTVTIQKRPSACKIFRSGFQWMEINHIMAQTEWFPCIYFYVKQLD